jgi:hypothetical protein
MALTTYMKEVPTSTGDDVGILILQNYVHIKWIILVHIYIKLYMISIQL